MLTKEDYKNDIENIISILEKYCLDNNYYNKKNDRYFTIDVPSLKKEKRLYHQFIIRIDILFLSYKISLYHNGFDNTKFIIDLTHYLSIKCILPSIIEKYIKFIILYRRKILETCDLYDDFEDFNKKLQDPHYIRDLKLNEILC
jgi:hypothetical protein